LERKLKSKIFVTKKPFKPTLLVLYFVGIILQRTSVAPPLELEIIVTASIGIILILGMIGFVSYKLVKKKS